MRDANSFDEFYRTTRVRLMGYGYAVTGDLAEAQDLVREAYTRAWQRWRTVSVHPNPEGWVRLVVTRLATDRWRRMGRQRAGADAVLAASVFQFGELSVAEVEAALRRRVTGYADAGGRHEGSV